MAIGPKNSPLTPEGSPTPESRTDGSRISVLVGSITSVAGAALAFYGYFTGNTYYQTVGGTAFVAGAGFAYVNLPTTNNQPVVLTVQRPIRDVATPTSPAAPKPQAEVPKAALVALPSTAVSQPAAPAPVPQAAKLLATTPAAIPSPALSQPAAPVTTPPAGKTVATSPAPLPSQATAPAPTPKAEGSSVKAPEVAVVPSRPVSHPAAPTPILQAEISRAKAEDAPDKPAEPVFVPGKIGADFLKKFETEEATPPRAGSGKVWSRPAGEVAQREPSVPRRPEKPSAPVVEKHEEKAPNLAGNTMEKRRQFGQAGTPPADASMKRVAAKADHVRVSSAPAPRHEILSVPETSEQPVKRAEEGKVEPSPVRVPTAAPQSEFLDTPRPVPEPLASQPPVLPEQATEQPAQQVEEPAPVRTAVPSPSPSEPSSPRDASARPKLERTTSESTIIRAASTPKMGELKRSLIRVQTQIKDKMAEAQRVNAEFSSAQSEAIAGLKASMAAVDKELKALIAEQARIVAEIRDPKSVGSRRSQVLGSDSLPPQPSPATPRVVEKSAREIMEDMHNPIVQTQARLDEARAWLVRLQADLETAEESFSPLKQAKEGRKPYDISRYTSLSRSIQSYGNDITEAQQKITSLESKLQELKTPRRKEKQDGTTLEQALGSMLGRKQPKEEEKPEDHDAGW